MPGKLVVSAGGWIKSFDAAAAKLPMGMFAGVLIAGTVLLVLEAALNPAHPLHLEGQGITSAKVLGFTQQADPARAARASGRSIITSVAADSSAERAGIAIGDVVLDIDGHAPLAERLSAGPHVVQLLHHGVERTLIVG